MHPLGYLLLLTPPDPSAAMTLRTLFRDVVGVEPAFRFLATDELFEVVSSPPMDTRDLFIGGAFDPATDSLALVRGNLQRIVVPVSMFRTKGAPKPDPTRLRFTDHGQTVLLGDYEAAADAILYERDADFRKRLGARRRREDKGFGPSLRRLRKQRGLRREDFAGISAKTIARLERGETQPNRHTRRAIEDRLDLTLDEILTY
ncbi:MAG: helix-turn-helix transcriptional regulator [Candidatus Eisenbacteria bacterium]|uniref:Helix-turn-helix transcriptional regulator n=1 Tax=Eiseniibacteriota bacterium TaxID=2212470 RepID=A0A956RQZ5_UNCEI|nr:helix-turn-helix transcriptional regulator [Candidatus Eisenbacteria bacterium]